MILSTEAIEKIGKEGIILCDFMIQDLKYCPESYCIGFASIRYIAQDVFSCEDVFSPSLFVLYPRIERI